MHEGRLLETFIPNYDVPFRYLDKLDLGWWKWLNYVVFLLWISEFVVNWFLLLIMKSVKESIYWDAKCNIFSFLNNTFWVWWQNWIYSSHHTFEFGDRTGFAVPIIHFEFGDRTGFTVPIIHFEFGDRTGFTVPIIHFEFGDRTGFAVPIIHFEFGDRTGFTVPIIYFEFGDRTGFTVPTIHFEFGDRTGFTVPIIHLKHKLHSIKARLLYCIVLLLSFEVHSHDWNLTYSAHWTFEIERCTPRLSLHMAKKVRSWESISLTATHVRNIYSTKVRLLGFISLTLRQLMSYIYGAPILDVFRSHTTTHHSR